MATNHGDMTGKIKAELAEKTAKEQQAKAKSMSMATAALEAEGSDDSPIEIETNESKAAALAAQVEVDGQIEIASVDETEKKVSFKVNTDIDDVTIGHGNNYSFERGKTYTAPWSVFWHLETAGLIWH